MVKTTKDAAHAHLEYLQFRPGDDIEFSHPPSRWFFKYGDSFVPYYRVHERVDLQSDADFVFHLLVFGFDSATNSVESQFIVLCIMDSFYQQTDTRLDWFAVTHAHDANLPHVHMVIMPTDLDGRYVRLSKSELDLLQEIANYYGSADRIEGTSYSEWLNEDNRVVYEE